MDLIAYMYPVLRRRVILGGKNMSYEVGSAVFFFLFFFFFFFFVFVFFFFFSSMALQFSADICF